MNFKMMPLALFILASYLLQINVADAAIGVNWGRQNAQRLLSSNVLDLILQNGIRNVRIFTTEEELLRAFAGSGIGLTINLNNINSFKTIEQAKFWFKSRNQYFKPSNVRQIYVADYAFSLFRNKVLINDAMQSLQSIQKVLNDEGYGDQIKVTIPHHRGILKINNITLRPSEAEFRDEIKPEMTTFLGILRENDAPFVVTITTIGDVQDFGIDFNFAFADNKSNLVINDINGAVYTNAFEIVYDSFIWALKKLNASDLRVIVGQVSWPTDGYPGANASMAERYYKSLLPFVSSNKGTPMRPGAPIDVYIQSLTDENRMPVWGNASFTRHLGIYMSNGKPKYKIDLTGQGRDIYPAEGKGIKRMPNRWCIFNGDDSDITKLRNQIEKACSLADCTTTAPGGSCSQLGFHLTASYAFNMHFQFQYQNESACDFEGLGYVSVKDPSTPECVFPIEVVGREKLTNFAETGHPNSTIFVILLLILIGAIVFERNIGNYSRSVGNRSL